MMLESLSIMKLSKDRTAPTRPVSSQMPSGEATAVGFILRVI